MQNSTRVLHSYLSCLRKFTAPRAMLVSDLHLIASALHFSVMQPHMASAPSGILHRMRHLAHEKVEHIYRRKPILQSPLRYTVLDNIKRHESRHCSSGPN